MHNTRIADVFDEIADLLEIQEGNQYRIRSYRNAARTVRDLGDPLQERVEAGEDLTDLPGIGESMADKIAEIVDSGTAKRRGLSFTMSINLILLAPEQAN